MLSPITGRVSGAKEVRVGTDKETITHLEVTIITGLQMTVFPDESLSGVFISQTSVNHKLVTQYQVSKVFFGRFVQKRLHSICEIGKNIYK